MALYIVLWILVALLGLVLIVVAVPVHVRGRGSVQGLDVDGTLEARWGWGFVKLVASPQVGAEARLLGLRIWRYRPKPPKKTKEEIEKEIEKKKEKERRKKEKARARRKPGPLAKTLGGWFHRKPLVELMRRILRTLRISLAIQGRLGLGDPADTAVAITVIRQVDEWMKHVRLWVEPEYEQDVVDIAGFFSARLWLLHVAFVFVAALFNRDIRRAMMAVR